MTATLDGGCTDEEAVGFHTLLGSRADSTFGMTLQDYVSFIESLGFLPIMEDDVGRERFHAYGRSDLGLLLTFDSYQKQRNSALLQFRSRYVPLEDELLFPQLIAVDRMGESGSVMHVAADGRANLLRLLALIEGYVTLQPAWGNADAEPGLVRLTLGQDEAVARRSGVPASGIGSYLSGISRRRADRFPGDWAVRFDLRGARTVAQADRESLTFQTARP